MASTYFASTYFAFFHSCLVSGWGFPPKVLTRTQQLALKAQKREANKTKKGKGKGNKTRSQDMSKPNKGVRKTGKVLQATSAASASKPATSKGSKVKPVEPKSLLKRSRSTKRMKVIKNKIQKGNVTKHKKGGFQGKGTAAKHSNTNKGNADAKKDKQTPAQDTEKPSPKAGQRTARHISSLFEFFKFNDQCINASKSFLSLL